MPPSVFLAVPAQFLRAVTAELGAVMAAGVPVLAYGAAAVPETLGGAGVCFTPKDLEWAAEILGMLVYDEELRAAVIANQRQRAADFSLAVAAQRLDALIARLS